MLSAERSLKSITSPFNDEARTQGRLVIRDFTIRRRKSSGNVTSLELRSCFQARGLLDMYFRLNRCHPCRSTIETKTFHLPYFVLYSRTSRRRPPKMPRLSGRLQESNHRAPLPRRGLGTSILTKIIYGMLFLSYAVCSSMLLLKFFTHVVYFKQPSAHSEHRDQRMRQVVAYKSLKAMENHY